MRDISELMARILSELEEAGEEDIQTLMVTTMKLTGDPQELIEIQQVFSALVSNGSVRLSIDRSSDGRLRELDIASSLVEIARLGERLIWNQNRRNWIDLRRSGPPFGETFPYVVVTTAGAEVASRILEEKGHRWWYSER